MLPNLVGESVLRSPMLALQEHMVVVLQAVEGLGDFVTVAQAGAWDRALQAQQRVADRESDADHLKQQLRGDMPKRMWMPVARSDLLDLLSAQDKIANRAKDVAGLMLGRQLAFPATMTDSINSYVALSVQATASALTAVEATQALYRSGFGERQAAEVERLIVEVERLERASDRRQVELRAQLFQVERDLPPVDVMFLYQILDWIGSIADRAEKVTHRLLLVIKS
ncbi:TIGR00153 family protein [Pseudohaliea rubra]|uniref:Phosphate transport regulator (Distant similar to PhoU) n=1 Tax=Pseudohaliea rubra DSM 19751 TaxID=1265313 RepID=A0A095XXJ5_9GAMM|nr:TIGR00153 family protein [Pseudohaliea rubra]KGE04451.1 Phosphate transport regulator (distant similar to PhoU) [Pseudohaliea rubra DSM 19751]